MSKKTFIICNQCQKVMGGILRLENAKYGEW